MSFTDKLIAMKVLKFNEGELSIFGIPGFIFMANTVGILNHNMEKRFGKDGIDLIYLLGKHQAYMGSSAFLGKYGYRKDLNSFNMVIKQSEMIGQGKSEILKFDQKNKILILKNLNSPVAKTIRGLYGIQKKPVCDFYRGATTGCFQAMFDEKNDFLGIETKCIAKGDPHCVIEVREITSWGKDNHLVKEQSPKESPENEEFSKFTLNNILKPS